VTEQNQPKPEIQDGKQPRIIDSNELFGCEKAVLISHDGQLYKLRITGRNKLILQK
jgi:hemin uptake protein HemP